MQSSFEEVIVRLAEANVEFVVVGGISAVLQGAPIITQDLDLCYRRDPDNLVRLARALAPLSPRLRGLPPEVPSAFDERTLQFGTNFTLSISGGDLDLLAEMSGIGGYEQIVDQADEMLVAGRKVLVLPLAQLIVTKEAANRPKDHATLPVLRATLELQRKKESAGDEPTATT